MNRANRTALTIALWLGIAAAAQAQWTDANTYSGWLSDAGATEEDVETIDFGLSIGTLLTDQYAAQGVEFTDTPPAEVFGTPLGNNRGAYRFGLAGPMTIAFPAGVIAVGIEYGDSTTPRFESHGHVSSTAPPVATGELGFKGLGNMAGITEVELWSGVGTIRIITLHVIAQGSAGPDDVLTCTFSGATAVASFLLPVEAGPVAGAQLIDYENGDICSEIPAPQPGTYWELRLITVPALK